MFTNDFNDYSRACGVQRFCEDREGCCVPQEQVPASGGVFLKNPEKVGAWGLFRGGTRALGEVFGPHGGGLKGPNVSRGHLADEKFVQFVPADTTMGFPGKARPSYGGREKGGGAQKKRGAAL